MSRTHFDAATFTRAGSRQADSDRSAQMPAMNPTLRQRLSEFWSRRRNQQSSLLAAQYAAVCAAALLVAIAIDAIKDDITYHYVGSCLFYAIVLLGAIRLVTQRLRSRFNFSREAQLLERDGWRAGYWELRELLVPAVELAIRPTGRHAGSPAFLQKVQDQAGEAVAQIDVDDILPWHSIARRLRRWLLLPLVLLTLMLAPWLNLAQRTGRILMPTANLGRVGLVTVHVTRPLPNSKIVATGDMVLVVAELIGAHLDKHEQTVMLETRDVAGKLLSTAMTRGAQGSVARDPSIARLASKQTFESMLAVTGDWIEYRVAADGARSPWYRLTTAQRPRPTRFFKSTRYPGYAEGLTEQSESDHANVTALAGSYIELAFETNIPTIKAELRWDTTTDPQQDLPTEKPLQPAGTPPSQPIPFTRDPSTGRLKCNFNADRSRTFTIFLQEPQHGFTNTFRPTYQLQVREDLPPRLQWQTPASSTVIMSPADVLSAELMVEDELPLETLVANVTLNGRILAAVDLSTKLHNATSEINTGPANYDTNAHLPRVKSDQPANADPHVLMRTMVVPWRYDLLPLKLSEGDHLEMTVTATDARQSTGRSNKLTIRISSASLNLDVDPTSKLRLKLAEQLESFAERARTLLASDQTIDDASAGPTRKLSEDAVELLTQIDQLARMTSDSNRRVELRRTGEAVLASYSHLKLLQWQTIRNESPPQIPSFAEQLVDRIAQTAESFRTFVTQEAVELIAGQIRKLHLQQSELAKNAQSKSVSIMQLNRQQAVLGLQLQRIERLVIKQLPTVRSQSRPKLQRVIDALGTEIGRIEREQDSPKWNTVQHNALAVAAALQRLGTADGIDGGIRNDSTEAYRELSLLGYQAHQLLLDTIDGVPDDGLGSIITLHLHHARSLIRATKTGDSRYSADLGYAGRAFNELTERNDVDVSQRRAQVVQLARALQVLSAQDQLKSSIDALATLLQRARKPDRQLPDQHTAAQWRHGYISLVSLPDALRDSVVDAETISKIQQLSRSPTTTEIKRAMSIKRIGPDAMLPSQGSLAADANWLGQELVRLEQQLAPYVAAARRLLRSLAPNAADLARRSAMKTKELADLTLKLSNQDDSSAEVAPTSLRQLQEQFRTTKHPIQQLRDSLVDLAELQDLLDSNQIELAQRADAERAEVDRVDERLAESMTGLDVANMPDASLGNQAAVESGQTSPQQILQTAAAEQITAAQQLAALADRLALSARQPTTASTNANAATGHAADALDKQAASPNDDAYQEAKMLAQLAEMAPEDLMSELDQELEGNSTMQQELSDLVRSAVALALQQLQASVDAQRQTAGRLRKSDSEQQSQEALLRRDLQFARDYASRILSPLISQSSWTAGAAKQDKAKIVLDTALEQLSSAYQGAAKIKPDANFVEIQAELSQLYTALERLQIELEPAMQLQASATGTPMHRTKAELNHRRREMADRARRIQQQIDRQTLQFERQDEERVARGAELTRQAERAASSAAKRTLELRRQASEVEEDTSERTAIDQQLLQALKQLAVARWRERSALATERKLKARQDVSQAHFRSSRAAAQIEMVKPNPSVELSLELARQAIDQSKWLAQQLLVWQDIKPELRLPAEAIRSALSELPGAKSSADQAAAELRRAATHQLRLTDDSEPDSLPNLANELAEIVETRFGKSAQSLQLALAASQMAEPIPLADPIKSASALSAIQESMQQLEQLSSQLQAWLESHRTETNPSEQQAANLPLDGQELAELLDALQQQLEGQSQLGEQDNNSPTVPSQGSQPSRPKPLERAAQKLSQQLSQSRQSSGENAPADVAMGTESEVADSSPQPPVAVRLLQVDRVGEDWGQLRTQSAEDASETVEERPILGYESQVEAYFRAIAEQANEAQP